MKPVAKSPAKNLKRKSSNDQIEHEKSKKLKTITTSSKAISSGLSLSRQPSNAVKSQQTRSQPSKSNKVPLKSSKGKSPTKSPKGKSPSKASCPSVLSYFTQQIIAEGEKESPWCFVCQMPFALKLSYQSNQTHVDTCLEMNYKKLPPCPEGLTCESQARTHYVKFNHIELANTRAHMAPHEAQPRQDQTTINLSSDASSSSNSDKRDSEDLDGSISDKRNCEDLDGSISDKRNCEDLDGSISDKRDSADFDGSQLRNMAKVTKSPEVCRVADRGDVRSSSSNWSDISKMFQPAATSSLKTSKTPTKDKSHPGKYSAISPEPVRTQPQAETSRSVFKIPSDPKSTNSSSTSSAERFTSKAGMHYDTSSAMTGQSEATQNRTNVQLNLDLSVGNGVSQDVSVSAGNRMPDDSIRSQEQPMRITAAEGASGSLHIEVNIKSSAELEKLVMVIPKSNENELQAQTENKVIDVVGRFRAQSNIQKFFKSTSNPNPSNVNPNSFLSNKEKTEAKKREERPSARSQYSARDRSVQANCPFYKKIGNTSFTVDAFNYGYVPGITKYFLSHFHYDHYRGLSKNWTGFPIYCSSITARLLQLKLRVDPKWIKPLELDQTYTLDGNIELRLLDANHCPGSVMFLFRFLSTGQVVLHVGDFRASPEMEESPAFWNCSVNRVYLDTTYCQPEYDFPSQHDVINKTVEIVLAHLENYPKTLICVGSYTIGKERIFMAIAEALDCKIFASTEKAKILKTLRDPIIEKRLTSVSSSARVHVIEMGKCRNRGYLKEYLDKFSNVLYDNVLSIVPTGWTHEKGSTSSSSLQHLKIRKSGPDIFQCDVPYSEHSSFSELKRFIQFLKLSSSDHIIPTVNVGNPEYRNAMKNLFREWVYGANKRI